MERSQLGSGPRIALTRIDWRLPGEPLAHARSRADAPPVTPTPARRSARSAPSLSPISAAAATPTVVISITSGFDGHSTLIFHAVAPARTPARGWLRSHALMSCTPSLAPIPFAPRRTAVPPKPARHGAPLGLSEAEPSTAPVARHGYPSQRRLAVGAIASSAARNRPAW
jgi:hypothetical protein